MYLMLIEEEKNESPKDPSQAPAQDFIFYVKNDSVMRNAVDLIPHFGKTENVILRARGRSIPNAVAIANILTEKMLRGKSKIQKITVDSELPEGMERMISNIEIIISKN